MLDSWWRVKGLLQLDKSLWTLHSMVRCFKCCALDNWEQACIDLYVYIYIPSKMQLAVTLLYPYLSQPPDMNIEKRYFAKDVFLGKSHIYGWNTADGFPSSRRPIVRVSESSVLPGFRCGSSRFIHAWFRSRVKRRYSPRPLIWSSVLNVTFRHQNHSEVLFPADQSNMSQCGHYPRASNHTK